MSESTGSSAPAPVTAPQGDSAPNVDASDAPEAVAAPTPQELKRKYKIKVDGEEVDEEVDFNDEAGMVNRLQLARGAKKRMAEAVSARQKAMDIVKQFEADPESMLSRLGPKGKEIAESYLLKQIQDEMLTPEQKEMRDLKRENETFKQKEAREKAEAEMSVAEKKEFEYAQTFQKTIIDALQTSGLSKSPKMVMRMAEIMKRNLSLGLELTPADLVSEVREEMLSEFKSVVGDSDGEQLINMFGKELANKIRRADLKSLQERQSQVFQGGGKKADQGSSQAGQRNGPVSVESFMEASRRRAKEIT